MQLRFDLVPRLLSTYAKINIAKVHILGVHWFDRFMSRHPDFRMAFVQYQERGRKAAADPEVQQHFFRMLANLIRRQGIKEEDIWNCDEKGITMGRNGARDMAIVRVGHRGYAITEGSREFCSVLETVNATGRVLPPFIVWQGKTHRKSYYQLDERGLEREIKREGEVKVEGAHSRDATFAVSPSGYMDNELGLEYMRHCNTHTQGGRARLLIVDGHASHVAYPVIDYALKQDIHVICLPSKSTHLLQPLDVGCFGILQKTYQKHLREWIHLNPLAALRKPDFLELLFPTRDKVYTVATITAAFRASGC